MRKIIFVFLLLFLSAPTYQWYKDGQKIDNTSDTLIMDSVSSKDAGTYYAIVDSTTSTLQTIYVSKIVDFDYSGESDGSFEKPYSSLKEAIGNSTEPVFLKVKEGKTSETIRINTPVKIEAIGKVTIGR